MKQIERRISFNGGELSPFTDGRVDLEKYRSGCRRMENFRPMIYGGAEFRGGSIYVANQPDQGNPARLVGFEFSATTRLMMVFTEEEFTVFTSGDVPAIPTMANDSVDGIWVTSAAYAKGAWIRSVVVGYEGIYYCLESHTSGSFTTDLAAGKWVLSTSFRRPTPYQASELAELQFAQINDVVYVTHPNHQQRVISRFADNKWTIELLEQEYPALRDENITPVALTPSAITGGPITVTASAATFQPGHVGSRWLIKHRRVDPFVTLALSSTAGAVSTKLMVLGEWSLTVITGAGTGDWEAVGVVERSTNSVSWETVRTLSAAKADRSGIITGSELEPCFLRIRLASKDGSTPTNGKFTLEAVDPDHYGLIEIIGYTSPTSVTADLLFDMGDNTSTKYWAEGSWSDYRGWPRSVCIHESRLYFGGNAAQPQTIWGSVIDDFTNFRLSSDADMGLSLTLAQKANSVQWMASQEVLLVGTAGAEGPIGSRETSATLSPTNAKVGRFSQTGSAFIDAIPVQDTVIFAQRNRSKLWEMAFSFERDGYQANDLTLLAEHITDGGITQLALQRYPEQVLWAVDAAGQLLGLAYERNQNVAGWFRVITDGQIESVAVIPGTRDDQVWITVLRGGVRFIERFQPNRLQLIKEDDQVHLCHSDCSVIYDGAETTTISGLVHLNGKAVAVVADGSPIPDKIVSGGQITLEIPASVVIVGLPYAGYLQPTYLATNDPASVSKVAVKNLFRVDIELWKSMGGSISANDGETWERIEYRDQGSLMDTALPLYTGIKEVKVDSRSERLRAPIIRQNQPLPLQVQSLHLHYEMNDA